MLNSTRINVRRFKSMQIALGEMQRYWYRDCLRTGSEFDQLNGLRSREIQGNWLIAAALNHDAGCERWSFTSERAGEHGVDGYLYDSTVNCGYPTEHTLAMEFGDAPTTTTEDRIIGAIAKGKILVVMVEGGEQIWHPNAFARKLPTNPQDVYELNTLQMCSALDNVYFRDEHTNLIALHKKADPYMRAAKATVHSMPLAGKPVEERQRIVAMHKADINMNLNLSMITLRGSAPSEYVRYMFDKYGGQWEREEVAETDAKKQSN